MFNKILRYYFSAYVYIQDVSHKSNKLSLKTKANTN